MSKKKYTIKIGILSLIISQILIKVIGLAYKMYLTNKDGFGDSGNAIYSSGFQIYALLLTFSSIGVPNAISKLVSERMALGDTKGANKIFKIAFFVFATIGLFGTVMLFISSELIAYKWVQIPEAKYSLIALSPSIFFVSITSVIRGYFNGIQNFSATAKSQTIEQIAKTLFTILLVEIVAMITKKNTSLMAGSANLATTIATMISFLSIYKYYNKHKNEIYEDVKKGINYKPTRIRKTMKKILKESMPISVTSLLSSFNKNIDLFTVVRNLRKNMNEDLAKKQYGILSGKIDTLCVLPLALNVPFVTSMIPVISTLNVKNDMHNLKKKVEDYLKITLIIGIPSTVGIYVFSNEIINLLFPNATDGNLLLKINSISIVFSMMTQTINGVLQGIGKSNKPMINFLIGILLKIIINISTIGNSNIGIKGAVYGNIVFNFIACFLGYIEIIKTIKVNINKSIIKICLATSIMVIVSKIIFINLKRIIYEKMATILVISVAVMIYLFLLFAFKLIKTKKRIKFTKKRGILSKIGE